MSSCNFAGAMRESMETKAGDVMTQPQTTKKRTFAKLKKSVSDLIWTLDKEHGGSHHDAECIICKAIYKAEEAAGLSHDY